MKSLKTIFAIAIASGNMFAGASNNVAHELIGQTSSANTNVIVQYKQSPSLLDLLAIKALGGSLTTTLTSMKISMATIPLSKVQALAANSNVAYISPDRPLAQMLDYSAAAVNASAAWNTGFTGRGVGVAVIDSGIEVERDFDVAGLLPRVVYRESFTGLAGVSDGYGHGTHVAGIIGASGLESSCSNCTRQLRGIAPESILIDLKALNRDGSGSDSAVISAIDRAIQLKNILNIRVINLSLGRPVYESYKLDPLCQAVEAAWKAGITVVVAAGNDGRDNAVGNEGYGTIGSPANDPYVITVGAMKAMGTYSRTDDLVASYSSKGPSGIDFVVKPDLVAPGNHTVSLKAIGSILAADSASAVPLSYYMATTDNSVSKQFMSLNGTSMATPVVSGAAADLLQAEPSLTPDQIKARLMKTAYKTFPESSTAVDSVTGQSFTSYYDTFTVGAGYLDIAAALANHDVASGNALSPTAAYNAADGNVYLVFDPASTWNQTPGPVQGSNTPDSVWLPQSIWGSSNVSPDRAVWGKQSVWDNSGVSGFRAVWGKRGVWGAETDQANGTITGTRAVWGKDSLTSDSDAVFNSNPK